MAFFQWREKFGPKGRSRILEEVFASRIKHLKNQRRRVDESMMEAEHSGVEYVEAT